MSFHYDATSDFHTSIAEVETLLTLASSDDTNRTMFLKLSMVSLVTKFQVFVEKILDEFRYQLNDKPSGKVPIHLKMNSLRISLDKDRALVGLEKYREYTEEKKENVVRYLNSISYISDDTVKINDELYFNTKFPLGKTGKKELVDLLTQIDGNKEPFDAFGSEKFAKLDSLLMTRHSIIHQDRFNGTDQTVKENLDFLKELVEYIDNYLDDKIKSMS